MNNDNDTYTIVFTNEMLQSIGINTKSDDIDIKISIENGTIKISKIENVL